MSEKKGPQPWERQKGELTRSFHLFCQYRDLGPNRSIRRLCKDVEGLKRRNIESLCRRWRWVERVTAWEDYQDEHVRGQILDARTDMAIRHITLSKALQAKATTAIELMDETKIKGTTAANMVKIATEIERLAVGEPTQVTEERLPAEVLEWYKRSLGSMDAETLRKSIQALEGATPSGDESRAGGEVPN